MVLPIEKILSLVLSRNTIICYVTCSTHLIIKFLFYYLSSDSLWEVKKKENFKLLDHACRPYEIKGGRIQEVPKNSDLTRTVLVFWKNGCQRQVVAYKS